MVWSTTTAVEEFLAEAGEFLRAEPARNSVVLTVAENLRVKVVTASPAAAVSASPAAAAAPGASPGSDRTLLGWWRPGADRGPVGGAFLHTPQFPVFLTAMSRRPPRPRRQRGAGVRGSLRRDLAAARRGRRAGPPPDAPVQAG